MYTYKCYRHIHVYGNVYIDIDIDIYRYRIYVWMFTYWCSHPGVDRVRNFKKSTNMGTCFVEQAPEWLQKPSIGLKFDLVWADGDWTIQIHTYFAGFLSAISSAKFSKKRGTHTAHRRKDCNTLHGFSSYIIRSFVCVWTFPRTVL